MNLFRVETSSRFTGYVVTNDDYAVAISSGSQAYMVCNMVNKIVRQVNPDLRINNCENCHHYNSLIDWEEGVFHRCMSGNNLWEICKDYDAIEEDKEFLEILKKERENE